jgi:hypothetical protein
LTKCEENNNTAVRNNISTFKEISYILYNNEGKPGDISNFLDADLDFGGNSPKWGASRKSIVFRPAVEDPSDIDVKLAKFSDDKVNELAPDPPKLQCNTKKDLLNLQKYMYIFSDTNDLQIGGVSSTKKPLTQIYDGDITNYNFRANTSNFEL